MRREKRIRADARPEASLVIEKTSSDFAPHHLFIVVTKAREVAFTIFATRPFSSPGHVANRFFGLAPVAPDSGCGHEFSHSAQASSSIGSFAQIAAVGSRRAQRFQRFQLRATFAFVFVDRHSHKLL
jgi:hypothetical protein